VMLVAAATGVGALTFLVAIRLLEPQLLREAAAFGRHTLPGRRPPRPAEAGRG